jgi:anti-sigma factor RsiW
MTTRCHQLHTHLDELLDGAVPELLRARLEDHLAGCPLCREELCAARQLRHRARALPVRVTPSRDLWPEIERRLAPRKAGVSLLAVAASILVALGLALFAALSMPGNDATTPPSDVARAGAQERAAELARYEDGALASRRELVRALERRREHLPPELATAIETNMEILQTAMGEIRYAIERYPGSHRLDHLLAKRYQQEAEILRQLERL